MNFSMKSLDAFDGLKLPQVAQQPLLFDTSIRNNLTYGCRRLPTQPAPHYCSIGCACKGPVGPRRIRRDSLVYTEGEQLGNYLAAGR